MKNRTKAAIALVSATIVSTTIAAAQQPRGQAAAGSAERRVAAGAADVEVHSFHVQGNVWLLTSEMANAAVSVGEEGVLVVDTMDDALADKMIAEIRKIAGDKPIRWIINTHAHSDHTGGNVKVAEAGESVVGGNFAGQVGQAAANFAQIMAHENVQARMTKAEGDRPPAPSAALPTDTFFSEESELYFNGEAVQLIHVPNAHTDGDVMVFFRKSDVLVAGDLFVTTNFPLVSMSEGGNFKGVIAAMNRMIDIAVPKEKQEGGTYVIPGHGRVTDEADLVDYRDMITIIRDRMQDAIDKNMTLEQVKAAKLLLDYEGRYGSPRGWSTDLFLEAAYRSLSPSAAVTRR